MIYNYSYYNIILKESQDFVYIYNSFSGALCKLEKDIYDLILNNEINDNVKCKYFDELYNQGFIKPKDLNEFNKIFLTERINILSSNNNKLSIIITPTLACNLNCEYCFEKDNRRNIAADDKTIIDIADFILKQLTLNIKEVHITWFGGEPLLAYNKIKLFNTYFKEKILCLNIKYSASMITNGILLDEEKVKFMVEKCNLKNIQITIDGTQEVYCKRKQATIKQYMQLLSNIKCAVNYLKVSIRLNCDGENYENLKEVAKYLINMCSKSNNLSIYLAKLVDYTTCQGTQFFNQLEFDKKKIEFNKYLSNLLDRPYRKRVVKYRPTFCGLYKLKNFVVGPTGELYKCEHHVGQKSREIGHIKYGYNYSNFMMEFLNNFPDESCIKCKLYPLCLGGCPAQKLDIPNNENCYISEYYIKSILNYYLIS